MLTNTDGIPSHFVKTQRLETLISFIAIFHVSKPKSVRQNHQNDRPLVTGNLSQVEANLGTNLCDNMLVPDHPETMPHSLSRSMLSEDRTSHFDFVSVFLLVKKTAMIALKYFGYLTQALFPGWIERHST
jgi:hypothetical protein